MTKFDSRAAADAAAHRETRGANSAFMHHAVWAPGVRLFRRLRFPAKAGLISLAFLIPLLLLGLAYLRASQENAAMVEQTAAAASTMRDQAQGLAEQIACFRMPG